MKASKIVIEAIKNFEGLRLNAYRCSSGTLTIGYGHTHNVTDDKTITTEEANELLLSDIRTCEKQIDGLRLKLNQGQFDSLISFVFNLGICNLKKSTLLKLIRNNPESTKIGDEFLKWVWAHGKKLNGLEKRRKWEKERYYSQFCRLF